METIPLYEDRIPWERKYCTDIIIPFLSNSIKCNICKEAFSSEGRTTHIYFTRHLYTSHKITELTGHPEREFLMQKFIINEETTVAQCLICTSTIFYDIYGVYLLNNHFEIYHGKKSILYERVVNIDKGRNILRKYFIKGSEATCPKCKLNIDWTDLEGDHERLIKLLRHYFSHNRYKKQKFFLFTKTRNQFYLFVPIIL